MAKRSVDAWIASRRGRAVAAGLVATASVALVLLLGTGGGTPSAVVVPSGGPASTGSSTSAPAAAQTAAGVQQTPAVPTAPSPAPSDAAWSTVELAALTPVADLTADDRDSVGVGLGTTFTLRSRGSTDASDLAARIETQPAIALTTEPGTDATSVRLRPDEPLAPGATYRFLLRTAAGTLAGSWVFQAEQPLQVVTILPNDEATNVPVDTGIEVTFDQDGVTDAADHFRIEPEVAGRFEMHDRTLAFVPAEELATETVYRVTMTPGVGVSGSDQVLESAFTFAFETAGAEQPADEPWSMSLGRPILEAAPDEPPVIGVQGFSRGPAPATLPVELYRLPSLAVAVEAAGTILSAPTWAQSSSTGLVPTTNLDRTLAVDAPLESIDRQGNHVISLPFSLDPGWYLVVFPRDGRDQQALLQVSEVAVYVMTTETQTVVWVNDVATGRPIRDAEITTVSGSSLAPSDDSGLSLTPTPDDLRHVIPERTDGARPIVIVTAPDGRTSLAVPGIPSGGTYAAETADVSRINTASERYWLVFSTDRTQYRQTDTLNAYGLIRERATGAVPRNLEVRLSTEEGAPAIGAIRTAPDARGMFAASIPFADLPLGFYAVELWADGRQVATTYFGVADIRKPAYAITVQTGHRAYVAGERIRASATVAFYDGTLAPGIELVINETRATTDALGVATIRYIADTGGEIERYQSIGVSAVPADPENGEIAGYRNIAVFPADAWIDAAGTLADGRLGVTGRLTSLDREKLERADADPYRGLDPAGLPIAARRVTAAITELVPVRTVTGRTYDFIQKRSIPVYSYEIRDVSRGTRSVTSGTDGRFSLSLDVDAPDHQYRVVLTAADGEGRRTQLTLHVSPDLPILPSAGARPMLADQQICSYVAPTRYRIGEPLAVTFRNGSGPLPTGGTNRYLFTVAKQGLLDAIVQASPTLDRPFAETDVPNAAVGAVWFTGRSYVPADFASSATLDLAERELTITITPDHERYRPGELVTLRVRTLDRLGRPTPASVVLRAVDEKLYAIGGGFDVDLLADLYEPVGSGVLGTSASHQPPFPSFGLGCGDTTGGGDDFRDWLLFRKVVTDAEGVATVSFPLSDDLTSWHVSAAAVNADYEGGTAMVLVPVGLPFFVEAVLAPEYLVGEQPVLRLRAFGSDLVAGDDVTFTLLAPTLGVAPMTLAGVAFEPITVPLPALPPGQHAVTIGGEAGSGPGRLTHRLVHRFTVIPSRAARSETHVAPLAADWRPDAASGLTIVTVTDAGRGRFLSALSAMAAGGGARVDQAVAADVARELLIEAFDQPDWLLPPTTFDPTRYQTGRGIALLPYSGPDLGLTVRVALAAPELFDPGLLREAFRHWLESSEATRERRAMTLAALASLDQPVLTAVADLAAEADLTIRERLYIGLAFAASGDDERARALQRDLLSEFGERLGPLVRLEVGTTLDDTLEATGLLALLSAALGDPIGADAEAYIEANLGHDDLFVLQQLAYVRRALERSDPAAGRFAATVGGERSVHDVAPGGTWSVTLTADQVATLRLEPLAGSLAVTSTRDVPFDASAVEADPDVSLERTITPAGDLPADALVRVAITVRFGPQATSSCYEITDRLPSGLAPLVRSLAFRDFGDSADALALAPYLVEGQRVAWCIGPTTTKREFRLGYSARVVSAGTYRWEPATAQSTSGSSRISVTPPLEINIR